MDIKLSNLKTTTTGEDSFVIETGEFSNLGVKEKLFINIFVSKHNPKIILEYKNQSYKNVNGSQSLERIKNCYFILTKDTFSFKKDSIILEMPSSFNQVAKTKFVSSMAQWNSENERSRSYIVRSIDDQGKYLDNYIVQENNKVVSNWENQKKLLSYLDNISVMASELNELFSYILDICDLDVIKKRLVRKIYNESMENIKFDSSFKSYKKIK